MCELLAAVGDAPFPISRLWPIVERLERFGIAGFGWGAAWTGGAGQLESHRDPGAFRGDVAGQAALGDIVSGTVLVHLRRPSRLSTVALPDTQPFVDPGGRFALAHNGDFQMFRSARERYRRIGRIHGRADSEVGQRWLEDAWDGADPPAALRTLHATFGGQANLGLLAADGTIHVYAGNTENPVFGFRIGDIRFVSTGLYSLDRSLFRLVANGAAERRLVRHRSVESLLPGA